MNRVLLSVPSVLLAIFCAACGEENNTPAGTGGGAAACTAPLTPCSNGCVDTMADSLNCGACGNACPAGRSCQLGVCACTPPLQPCGAACADVTSDGNNCGFCGNVCPAGQVCSASACSSSGCGAGLTPCGTSCVDTNVNPLNCGQCNMACGAGQTCTAGVCTGGTATGGAGGGTGVGGSPSGGGGGTPATGGVSGTTSGGAGGGTTTGGAGGAPAGGAPAGGAPADGGTTSGGAGGSTGGAGTDGGSGGTATGGDQGTGGAEDPSAVTVQLDKTFQTIQGFGINSALMPNDKTLPIDTLFSTTGPDGIGLSILRVGMTPQGTLTGKYVSEAKAKGAKIIGSCWTPPAECKSNNSTQNGGHLLTPEEDGDGHCYAEWASKIANFAKDQGLYAMSIANESDFASCPGNPVCTTAYDTTTYTAKQMVSWVKVAGKKIKEVSPSTLVIAPEASEWIHAWSNLSGTGSIVSGHPDSSDPHQCGCFSNTITAEKEATCAQKCLDGDGYDYGHWMWEDQDAWNSFDIFGVHQYDSQIAFAWPADVNDGVRDKEVWQTEMSGVMHWPEQGPSTDIDNGIAVAGWIHSALTVGEASAWLYWWYEPYYENDNEGLAVIQGSSTKAKRYYTMGNYSKFVRPESVAVAVTGPVPEGVLLSAYKGKDGSVIVVAINKGGAAEVPITIAGGTAPASCTPTVTSADDNLKDGTAVSVAAGVLTASLGSETVTTFVCK